MYPKNTGEDAFNADVNAFRLFILKILQQGGIVVKVQYKYVDDVQYID